MTKTISIIRTGGIGDVILSIVSINIIKDKLPNSEILWFGREPTASLIKNAFPDIKIFEISSDNSYSENLRVLKKSSKKMDVIIDLQHSARSIILGRLAAFHFNCKYHTWNKYSLERSALVLQSAIRGRKFNFDLFKKELPNRYEAMTACTLKALKEFTKNGSKEKKYVPCFNSLLSEKNTETVSVCLGAKFQAKILPIPQIEKIIREIITNKKIKTIYFLGKEDQKENAEKLIKLFSPEIEMFNRCGSTTLTEAAKILSKSRFAIANDSGLAHLSETVNTPVLVFFGPTHPKFGYRPFLKNSRMLFVDLSCRPCNKNGDVKCRYKDHACSASIGDLDLINHLSLMHEG